MNLISSLFILIVTFFSPFASCFDNVSESLTLRPLTNGDWLLVLDVSIVSKDLKYLFENPEDPHFFMDSMPIDVAKLYVKTKSNWFEANLGFGEWKDTVWGDRPEMLITNGLSLVGCWQFLDKKVVRDHFSTLCYGLWGVTGTMFSNLVSQESFIHDVTHLYANDYENNSKRTFTVLLASDFEDRACLDALYKLRMIYPCLCTNGLVSVLGDERLFVRSSYRGINLRVERVNNDLSFKARVQFTVPSSKLPETFSGFFPDNRIPRVCLTTSESIVNLVYPNSLRSQNYNSTSFNYMDPKSRELLDDKYQQLKLKFKNGYELIGTSSELVYEVSELESRYLRVLKRVQSSLLIKVANLSNQYKKVCVHQPLPYWLKPLVHSLNVVVEYMGENITLYQCKAADCFARNSASSVNFNLLTDTMDRLLPYRFHPYLHAIINLFDPVPNLPTSTNDPLIIYELGNNWNQFGIYISLPPNSVMYLSAELSKDNITYEDIHLAAHRGQLIPAGLLLDLSNLNSCSSYDSPYNFKALSSYSCNHYYYFLTSFFSHIVLPDNTMIFNVMAAVGAVSALLFGFVFNTLTKDWEKSLNVP
ncbi:hypothetical protein MACJ_003104 [Theileria orientalis]|uniref:Uncharacterized protein n=1 Tax=Theileria orientalis TaxID=68886 RepID=A0A976QVW9_THEOR|nr:hypothetical protein MACJ_003104 [Theileria orientalis]